MNAKMMVMIAVLWMLTFQWVLAQASNDAAQPLTAESAKRLLRQGFDLRAQKQYQAAVDMLERVVRFSPRLEAGFPDEGIQLQATGELAMTYYAQGNYEKALPLLEQFDKDMREEHPDADLLSPSAIAECRTQLGLASKLDREPIVIARSQYVLGDCGSTNGVLLLSASKLAQALGVKVTQHGDRLVMASVGAEGKSIVLTAGSKDASAATSSGDRSKHIPLPMAPMRCGRDIFLPLRAVAEYFGARVKWDPLPKVAWVR